MRELNEAGVPFDIEFYSYQDSKNKTEGLKKAKGVLLRTGLSKELSDKADLLIGYQAGKDARFFYLPLLIKFNNTYINEY